MIDSPAYKSSSRAALRDRLALRISCCRGATTGSDEKTLQLIVLWRVAGDVCLPLLRAHRAETRANSCSLLINCRFTRYFASVLAQPSTSGVCLLSSRDHFYLIYFVARVKKEIIFHDLNLCDQEFRDRAKLLKSVEVSEL